MVYFQLNKLYFLPKYSSIVEFSSLNLTKYSSSLNFTDFFSSLNKIATRNKKEKKKW